MFKKIVFSIAMSVALSVQATEPVDLMVTISSGSTMSQGAALVLAGQALEQRAQVRILLCDAGGDIALIGKPGATLKPRNVTPQQMVQGLMKNGAKVEVCALYLPNSGNKPSDLIDGVTAAKPSDVTAFILKPNVRTLSF
jgi:predicted peroxiredoxin